MAGIDLTKLQTEGRNPRSARIDQVSTLELCDIINTEDEACARAVRSCLPVIAAAIDALSERVRCSGRVIYVGAGTSGRLGVLDASEIPPTYSVPASQFVGLIAGGDAAIRNAQEGAEDSWEGAERDMLAQHLDPSKDSLIGIAASGRTPYVLGCLAFAKKMGCSTVGVACCEPSPMSEAGTVDFMIAPVTGPEVVTGSTRMKAGTATKLVLNTLSTGVMIKAGKTYGNLMVDMKPSNAKLIARSHGMIRAVCGSLAPSSDRELDALLNECDGSLKLVMASLKLQLPVQESKARLEAAGGRLSEAIWRQSLRPGKGADSSVSELCLCIDGGGTKCSAVIMATDGRMFEGRGQPCNITDSSIADAMGAIRDTIYQAFVQLQHHCREYQSVEAESARFAAAWVGLAGYGRPQNRAAIDSALVSMLQLPLGPRLRVTNDIDLHAAVMHSQPRVKSAVALVAGTGSVAMSYERRDREVVRTGRSGGWGYMLGDDGSGFDIGRKAIRIALAELDGARSSPALSAFSQSVLSHLGIVGGQKVSASDVLGAVLLSSETQEHDGRVARSKIASLAPVVISQSRGKEGQHIVSGGVRALADEVRQLLSSSGIDPGASCLIVGGGLLSKNDSYRDAVLAALRVQGITFQDSMNIDSPARSGAQALRSIMRSGTESRVATAKL